MTKKHISNKPFDKDYLIQKKVPKHLQPKFDEWRQIRNLPLGKEVRSQIGDIILDIILNETSFLSQELIKKLDNVFIEGTLKEKINFITDRFLDLHKKFPYLTIQRAITPEDAGFLPCPFVKAIYWKGEFLGFHCRAIKPLAFKLPSIRVGKLSLQITTPEDCVDCQELCRMNKVGVDIFSHISTKQITLAKEQLRLRKQTKSSYEKEITEKLQQEGMRMIYPEVKAIFEHLKFHKKTGKWKKISEASKATGKSRPTIYKLLEIFPEGLR